MIEEKHPIILCVDDDKQNLALLEATLSSQGYRLQFSTSGEDAFVKIAAQLPDLILLDVMMPGLSGLDVLKRLRADEQTRLIPVVLLTALREEEDKIEGIEVGCDDFISKPFSIAEVLARVRALLKISFYRRSLDAKEKFEAVINGMGDGVIVCNPDWLIIEGNTSAKKYLNITETKNCNLLDLIFKNYSLAITKEDLADFNQPHKKFDLLRKETAHFKPLYLEVDLDVLKNPLGEIVSIVLVIRDVTEQRREERLKQDFLSLISHKLLTPTTVIFGNIELLRDEISGPLTKEQKDVVCDLIDRTKSLISLIDKLVKFTALTAVQNALGTENIKVYERLVSLTGQMLKRETAKKIELNIECSPELTLHVNKSYFENMMRNLISNALKFNDKEIAQVTISAKSINDMVELAVSDNGRGIPPEEHNKIFQKFYQGEKYFTGQVEGTGLGLALVKHIVDACQGTVDFRSEIGKGTTFVVRLPNPHA